MKLCRFTAANVTQVGILTEGSVSPLQISGAPVTDITQLMALTDLSTAESQDSIAIHDVQLLAPIHRPDKIICIGLNYKDHAEETGMQLPEKPVVFNKFPSTIIGPGDPIILPSVSEQVDYEAELVVVIGKHGYCISEADAMNHVFGYSCGHDVSARDWQKGAPGHQWLLGKSCDNFAPLGPCVVPKADIPDPESLAIKMHVSGETLQDGCTQELVFSIPQLIAHISQVCSLLPGDLIFTGTPPGVGMARDPKRFLKPGDTCNVEVEGIGILSNPCIAADSTEAEAFRERRYGIG